MEKKLYRDEHRKVVAGVCAGLADYLSIDVTVIRAIFLITLILKGGGGIIYIILWIVLPKKIHYFNDPQVVDYTVPPANNPFNMPPQPIMRKRSNGGLIAGVLLVLFGSFFLLHQFDIIPDWDFTRIWPIGLIVAGAILLFARSSDKPWEKPDWHEPVKSEPVKEESAKKEDTTNNDTPTA